MLRTILILLLYGVGTVLGLRDAAFASCFFSWSEIFRPLDFARRVYEFPAAHLVVIVLALSIFLRRWERRWNAAAVLLLAICAWVFFCSLISRYSRPALERAELVAKYVIPLAFISLSLTKRWSQNLYVFTLAASVGVWGAQGGLHAIRTGAAVSDMGIPGGQMTDRNDFMVGVLGAIPLIFYAGWAYQGRFQKWIRIGAKAMGALCIIAVVCSESRAAMLALGVLAIYFLVATGRTGKKLLIGGIVVAAGLPFVPDFAVDRMKTIETTSLEEQSEASAQSRVAMMKLAFQVALDHPIAGVGCGNFPKVSSHMYGGKELDPHCIWLKAAAEYGFPMLIVFMLFTARVLRGLSRERKIARAAGDRDTERLATALSCAFVGYLTAATFHSIFLSQYLWSMFAVACAFLAERQAHARKAAQESYGLAYAARRAAAAPSAAPTESSPARGGV